MAYMSQERKSAMAPRIKAVLKKYGIKGTLSVDNHTTLVLTLKEGKIDFIANYNRVNSDPMHIMRARAHLTDNDAMDVNPYWYQDHFDGAARNFLREVLAAMNDGNHDNSNAQIDYFDVGWYVNVKIGKWRMPYAVTE